MKTEKANEILGRLKQVFAVYTDKDLAERLGLAKQSIASARRNQRIPDGWLAKISQDYGVSLDWLKWGIGSEPKLPSKLLRIASRMTGGCMVPFSGGTAALGIALGGLMTKLAGMSEDFSKEPSGCTENQTQKMIENMLKEIDAFYGSKISELEHRLQAVETERQELYKENKELRKANFELLEKFAQFTFSRNMQGNMSLENADEDK